MARYEYYVVESSYVVRTRRGRAERLTEDGRWVDYPDLWDVATNGRWVKGGEAAALREAEEIFGQRRRAKEAERAVEAYRARGPSRAVAEILETGPEARGPREGTDGSAHVSLRTCRPAVPDGSKAVEARIAPDGRRVAVAWVGGDAAGIEVGGEGEGQPLARLGEERPSDLAWSPGGSRLAYRICGGSAIQDQIAWIDTGTPLAEQGRVNGSVFAWSSGDRELYVAYGPYAEIARYDATTGEREPLVYYHTYLPRDFRPRILLSPPGNRLTFTTREARDDESWVFVFDLETEELSVVTRVPGADAHLMPCWAPDGEGLAVYLAHGPSARTGLLVFRLSDGTEEMLRASTGVGRAFSPAWSPDGRYIAFFDDGALCLLDVSTRARQRLCEPGLLAGDLRFLDEDRLAVDGGPTAYTLVLGRGIRAG
jgi:dipeptidyl aminopeptidase/acylaminoacyl peptidase